ncbi:gliding motility-associated ABC transporter substrate-binding protein GldG [Myroides sp. LJL119]
MRLATKNNLKNLAGILVVLLLVNLLSSSFFARFDLTNDKRYTLSKATLKVIDQVESPVVIDVFLKGDLPQEFRRLQSETKQILEEFSLRNPLIKFQFINPLQEQGQSEDQILYQLYEYGIKPVSLTVNDKGTQTQMVVLPWAIVSGNEKAVKAQLLKSLMGASTQESVIVSVQYLEYAFTNAISQVIENQKKSIAVLKGNGELEDLQMADFLMDLGNKYNIAAYTLDSVASYPVQTLEGLKAFDMFIMAKPTKDFSYEQLAVLDQFIMQGGKSLWLLDPVQANMDSIQIKGKTFAYANKQTLGELLFKYGVRINPVLVKDEMGTALKIASGAKGSQTLYSEAIWKFSPFVYPVSDHPIVKNIEGLKLEFTSPMDTLKNNIDKTVLLQSSAYSNLVGTPVEISLDVLNEKTTPQMYQDKGNYILGVLLQGEFSSLFNNRVLPFDIPNFLQQSKFNKMIVISDGDVIKNQFDQNGAPLELGYDKWTNRLYGNKDFLNNSVDYLLQDNNLLELRTKEVRLAMLDKMKVYDNYSYIQFLALTIPIVIVMLFGIIFFIIRKSKLVKK